MVDSSIVKQQSPDAIFDADKELLSGGSIAHLDTSFKSDIDLDTEQRYFRVGRIRDKKTSTTALRFDKQSERIEIVKNALMKSDTVSESVGCKQEPIVSQREFQSVPETKNKLSFRKMAELFEEKNRFLMIDKNLNIYDQNHGLFVPLNNENFDALIRRQAPEEMKDHLSRYVINELLLWLKSKTHWKKIDGEELKNLNSNYINFINGTLDFCSLKIYNHNPDFCCTNVLNVSYSNSYVDYRKSLFFKVVNDLLGDDQKKIYLLQEIYGVTIAGILLKQFYYFFGLPDSGKSKIADLLRYIIGTEYTSAMTLKKFDSQFGLGGLYRKRLNLAGESNEITSGGVEIIKRITGGDYALGERKYEHAFEFCPQAVLIFMSNHKLQVLDGQADQALLNRMVVLEFSQSIPLERQDTKLSSKLKEPQEINAAISWALEGAKRVYDNNYKLSYYPNAENYVNSSPLIPKNRQAEFANHFREYLVDTFDIEPKNRENYVTVPDVFSGFMDYIGVTEDFEYQDSLLLHNILQNEFCLVKKRVKPTGQKQQVYVYMGMKLKPNLTGGN